MFHAETQTALNAAIGKAREQIAESDRDAAARRYIEAKRAEEKAKDERLEAEAEILRLFGAKAEGSQTVKSELFAVKTTGNMNYKVDAEAFDRIKGNLPKSVRDSIVRYKPELSISAYRALQKDHPELYADFAACLTITPAKASVEVQILSLNS